MFSCMRDVLLLSCVVILQGSGAAKYKSCSRVPHSELMKSGPAQERADHTHWAGCGGSYCTVQALTAKPIRSEENGFKISDTARGSRHSKPCARIV